MGNILPWNFVRTEKFLPSYIRYIFWRLALQLLINPTGLASLAQPARWIGMCTQHRGGSARLRPSYVARLTCR